MNRIYIVGHPTRSLRDWMARPFSCLRSASASNKYPSSPSPPRTPLACLSRQRQTGPVNQIVG